MLLTPGCIAFTLGGLWMIVQGEGEDILARLVCVAFFGGFGLLYTILKLLRCNVSMVLTRRGIEQQTLYGAAHILLKDVKRIGIILQFGTRMAGMRLRTYDNYLDNMSPQLVGFITKSLPYLLIHKDLALWQVKHRNLSAGDGTGRLKGKDKAYQEDAVTFTMDDKSYS